MDLYWKFNSLILIATAVLLSCGTALTEQPNTPDPDRWGVSSHCYEFHPENDTPAPAGYKPVYLSHYGRHGSRTGMKVGDSYDVVIGALQAARKQKLLTPQGDSLLNEVCAVNACHNDMEGRLTRVGEAEQHELGRRIWRRYRPVFRSGSKKVRVELSTVPRSIVSGMCFVQTLSSLQPDIHFDIDTGEKYFAYINNTAPKEVRAAVRAKRDSLNALCISDGREFCARVFKDTEKGLALIGNPDDFQHKVWTCAREGKASGVEADMYRHLPEDVVRKWWADAVRSLYMCHGNSLEYGEARMVEAEPLVKVMLSQAREALATGTVVADLKFGHDYPILATASYFGLEGVGDRLGWDDLPEAWSDPMNIPFASNMQMAFYRGRKGDVLVKFVYNGRERLLRELTPVSGPYYRWEDVYARFMPEGDEKTFSSAEWNWRPLKGGAEVGYAQLPLFDSMQSISVIRYPLRKVKTFLANDSADAADSTSALALRHGGFAAINASYFNVTTLYPTTYTKDDGRQEGWTEARELFRVDGAVAIRRAHKLKIFTSDTLSYSRQARWCREALAAGPVLLKDGNVARPEWPAGKFYEGRHPRTVIGTTADGWGYLIVIDGRFQEGIGTTIQETAQICSWFGLRDAINLDGGGSSVLWTEAYGVISHPYDNRRFDQAGQRIVPNIIYLK